MGAAAGLIVPLWAVLSLIVAFLGGLAFALWKIFMSGPKYVPLACEGTPKVDWAVCAASTKFDLTKACAKWKAAILALSEVWPRDSIDRALSQITIHLSIEATETWQSTHDQGTVAGQEFGQTLELGPSLYALAHELAHYLEGPLAGRFDNVQHAGWSSLGSAGTSINMACANYERMAHKIDEGADPATAVIVTGR